MLVTDSIVLTTLNSFLLPITKEVLVCAGQRTISANFLYYSNFDQEVNVLFKF